MWYRLILLQSILLHFFAVILLFRFLFSLKILTVRIPFLFPTCCPSSPCSVLFCSVPLLEVSSGRGGGSTNRIAEVVYDASIGLWGYLHLRKGGVHSCVELDTLHGLSFFFSFLRPFPPTSFPFFCLPLLIPSYLLPFRSSFVHLIFSHHILPYLVVYFSSYPNFTFLPPPLFHLIVSDKTEPNYIDTVIGVFMEQAEGISVEELQYRMLSKGDSADDYHAHLQKMKIKLLDWQAKYVCLFLWLLMSVSNCSKP